MPKLIRILKICDWVPVGKFTHIEIVLPGLKTFEQQSDAFNNDEATMNEIFRIFETYDPRMRPHMGQTLNITGSVLQITVVCIKFFDKRLR